MMKAPRLATAVLAGWLGLSSFGCKPPAREIKKDQETFNYIFSDSTGGTLEQRVGNRARHDAVTIISNYKNWCAKVDTIMDNLVADHAHYPYYAPYLHVHKDDIESLFRWIKLTEHDVESGRRLCKEYGTLLPDSTRTRLQQLRVPKKYIKFKKNCSVDFFDRNGIDVYMFLGSNLPRR